MPENNDAFYPVKIKKRDEIILHNSDLPEKYVKSKEYYDKLTGDGGRFAYFEYNDRLFPYAKQQMESKYKCGNDDFNISELTSIEGNFVLIGEGGIGKTTSLLRAWKEYLANKIFVPIYVSLNEFNEKKSVRFINDYIVNNYDFSIDSFIEPEGFVLLLDGFNEITGDNKTVIDEIKLIQRNSKKNNIKIKIILTSRYDMITAYSLEGFVKYYIQPLNHQIIEEYLIENHVFSKKIPYDILKNPMMLTLYTNSCLMKRKMVIEFDYLLEDTAAALIYNFLLCQVGKAYQNSNIEELYLTFISLFITAPFIAYKIEKRGSFKFEQKNLNKYISESLETCDNKLNVLINEKLYMINYDFNCFELNKNHILKINFILLKTLAILNNEGNSFVFRHQYFRDFFSGFHIINTALTLKNDDRVPEELSSRIIPQYIAEMIGAYQQDQYSNLKKHNKNLLHKLLDYSRNKQSTELGLLVNNVINIQRIARKDILITDDFSHIDLSQVLLNGITFSRESQKSSFKNSIISSATFMPIGHIGQVRSAIYNFDESIILSAGGSTIKEWDVHTGQCLFTYFDHTNLVNSAFYSSDDKNIISASNDNTVKIWKRGKANSIETLYNQKAYITKAIFSHDNNTIYSSSWDGTVMKYMKNNEKWECCGPVANHDENVKSVCLSKDGMQILSASGDNTVKEWNLSEKNCTCIYVGHNNMVNSVEYSPDNKYIVSASYDNTVNLYIKQNQDNKNNIIYCRPFKTYHNNCWVRNAIFDSTVDAVIIACQDGKIKELKIEQFESPSGEFIGHTKAVIGVSLNKDGTKILSTSEDGTIIEWDRKTRQLIQIFSGFDFSTTETVYDSKGLNVLTIKGSEVIESYRNTGLPTGFSAKCQELITSAIYSSDDEFILTTSKDNYVCEWDKNSTSFNKFPLNISNDFSAFYASYDSSNENIAVLFKHNNSNKKEILIQIFNKNKIDSSMLSFHLPINARVVKFGENDDTLLTFSDDGIVREWDVSSGLLLRVLGVYINSCDFEDAIFKDKLSKQLISDSGGILNSILLSKLQIFSTSIKKYKDVDIKNNKSVVLFSNNRTRLNKLTFDIFSNRINPMINLLFKSETDENLMNMQQVFKANFNYFIKHLNFRNMSLKTSTEELLELIEKNYANLKFLFLELNINDISGDELNYNDDIYVLTLLIYNILIDDKQYINLLNRYKSGLIIYDHIEDMLSSDMKELLLQNIPKLFPNIQFIFTTSSFDVLTRIKDNYCIYNLDQEEII